MVITTHSAIYVKMGGSKIGTQLHTGRSNQMHNHSFLKKFTDSQSLNNSRQALQNVFTMDFKPNQGAELPPFFYLFGYFINDETK